MARQFEFMRDEIKDVKQQNQDLHTVLTQLTELIGMRSSRPIDLPGQDYSRKSSHISNVN